jgi:hypothetical protein
MAAPASDPKVEDVESESGSDTDDEMPVRIQNLVAFAPRIMLSESHLAVGTPTA